MKFVVVQWIIFILLINYGNCSGKEVQTKIVGTVEKNILKNILKDLNKIKIESEILEESTGEDKVAYPVTIRPIEDCKKPSTPDEFEYLLTKAATLMKLDGMLDYIINKLEEITIEKGKYIHYVRLIGPGSMVQHDDHGFYSKEAWNDWQNVSIEDKEFETLRHQLSSIFQAAFMIEVVKHFNNIQNKVGRNKIEATIEDLHLDSNEIEYYKGLKEIKIDPIKVEMPELKDFRQKTNKTLNKSTNPKKGRKNHSKANLGASSSSNTKISEKKGKEKVEEDIWPSEEWINWLKNEPNNLNTIPKKLSKMLNDEMTLVLIFDCQYPMVKELMKTYSKNVKKNKLILIDTSLASNCEFWGFNKEDTDLVSKLFGDIIKFPETKLNYLFGYNTAIYYNN